MDPLDRIHQVSVQLRNKSVRLPMTKELTVTNGDVQDADDPVCTDCEIILIPSHKYCPYCGEAL